jgi:hypothetical protein
MRRQIEHTQIHTHSLYKGETRTYWVLFGIRRQITLALSLSHTQTHMHSVNTECIRTYWVRLRDWEER